jgi:hypothetical protein
MIEAIRLNPIKQLVRDRSTGLFLSDDGDWTADQSHAAGFKTLSEAVRVCQQHGVREGDVLLKFGGERYDLVLPLADGNGEI